MPSWRTTPIDPLATQLREIRHHLGLSLAAVEEKSAGVWKAMVVASWERGDRQASVPNLRRLLDFYGGWRLEVLASADVVVREGTMGKSYVEYFVAYGAKLDGTIGCDNLAEATTIASYIPGSRVAYRTHVVGELTFTNGGTR